MTLQKYSIKYFPQRTQSSNKLFPYKPQMKNKNKTQFHNNKSSNEVYEFILLGNLFNLQYPLYEIFHLFLIIPYALYTFSARLIRIDIFEDIESEFL